MFYRRMLIYAEKGSNQPWKFVCAAENQLLNELVCLLYSFRKFLDKRQNSLEWLNWRKYYWLLGFYCQIKYFITEHHGIFSNPCSKSKKTNGFLFQKQLNQTFRIYSVLSEIGVILCFGEWRICLDVFHHSFSSYFASPKCC